MKNPKPGAAAPTFAVTLSKPAAEYLERLTRKYRATPEQFIQAAAEQTLANCFEALWGNVSELALEDFLSRAAIDLAEGGEIEGLKENWLAAEKYKSERAASKTTGSVK